MPSTLLVILALCAVWRVARLVTVDEVTRPIRERIAGRGDRWAYFITCPWCTSIWIGPLVAWAVVYHDNNRVVQIIVIALAASMVAGIGQAVEDRLDR